MHAKVGVTPAYVLSQLTTAVLGAACFITTIAFVNSLKTSLFEPALHVSPTQFSWVSNLNFDVERDVQFLSSANVPNLENLVATNVSNDLVQISKLEVRAKKQRKQAWTHLADVARANRRAAEQDALRIEQAAPVAAPQEYIPAPGEEAPSDLTEDQKLQKIHSALLNQFHVSMNELAAPSTTQVAAADVSVQPVQQTGAQSDLGLDAVPGAPLPAPKKPVPHKAPARVVAKEEESKPAPAQEAAVLVAANQATQTDSIHLSAAAESEGETVVNSQAGIVTKVDPKSAAIDDFAKRAEKLQGYEEVPPPPTDTETVRPIAVTSTTSTADQTTDGRDPPPPSQAAPAAAAAQKAPQPTSETVSFMGTTLVLPTAYPKGATGGYSNGHPSTGAMSTQPGPKAPTSEYPAGNRVAANVMGSHSASLGSPALMNAMAALPSILAKPELQTIPSVSFVEAFDWTHSISDAQAEILTREDASEAYGQSHTGWRIARSSEHWPSVYWNQSGQIPMLSKNAAKLLAMKTGAPLQEEAGILIAKAPAGWSLEFGGRAEHPLIFSETNQLLATDSVEQGRYYVFLNASPGAQILYLVKSGETGVLALPVFGGMLSFADLSQPEHRAITGKVLDTSGTSTRGTGGVRVQLVGSGQTTVTNGSGSFQFPNVVTFGSQPLFVETESNHGYPHRYKLNPKSAKQPLFELSEDQIHDWVGQLEGGVSSESGLIVGALPTVAAANEDRKPIPSIKTLATDPTLSPETYTLSSSGQLMVKTPLTAANSRVVGVQVPEGPALIQLTDKDGKVLWSELLVVSPRVLSVVGPY